MARIFVIPFSTAPFSEPETQVVRDFILSRPLEVHWDTHTFGNLLMCPFGYANVLPPGQDWPMYQEYLDDMTAENGYEHGPIYTTIYPASGGSCCVEVGAPPQAASGSNRVRIREMRRGMASRFMVC